jgi:hypothetical protein
LYPNGTVILEFDDTIPSNIMEYDTLTTSAAVGYSTGRVYTDASGTYHPEAHPNVRSFDELLLGASSANTDAIAQTYDGLIPANWASNAGSSYPFVSVQ